MRHLEAKDVMADDFAQRRLLEDEEDANAPPPDLGGRLEWILIQYLDMVQPWSLHSRHASHQKVSTATRVKIYVATWPTALRNSRLWTLLFAAAFIVACIFALVALANLGNVVPDLRSLQSDVTMLMHNDLYGLESLRNEAVMVLSKLQTRAEAANACALLGETLLDVDGTEDYESILTYLGYLDDATIYNKYWVLGHSAQDCYAISQRGQVTVEDCTQSFAALCSQQAPMSSILGVDRSHRWQMTVPLADTTLRGYRDKRSFRFEGIRYAQQPTRFAHSALHEPAGDETRAISPPSWCVQLNSQGSEDCLFLNVWTPYIPMDPATSPKLRPVLFYIHGGAFVAGSGAQSIFDGGNMASRGDVVVVTINYRIGTFGFLSLAGNGANGNWGLGDQLVALEWVRTYIRWLGGDPDRITVVGQSAGAASVRALLGSPRAAGQFSKAILQSNLGGFGFAESFSEYADPVYAYFNESVPVLAGSGCVDAADQLACMRKVDAHTLGNMVIQAASLVQDGDFIPYPHLPLGPGSSSEVVAQIPLLIGTMLDDGVVFVPPPFTPDAQVALDYFGLDSPTLLEGFPPAFPVPIGEPIAAAYNVLARAGTDVLFRCTNYATAAALSLRAPTLTFSPPDSTYYYEMNRAYGYYPSLPQCMPPPSPDTGHPLGDPESGEYYKCHSGELLFVFGNLAYHGLPPRDDFDVPLSQYLLDTWTQFVHNGDPNPRLDWLAARGYTNTTLAAVQDGLWPPVGLATAPDELGNGGSMFMMRKLAAQGYTSVDMPFAETEQCRLLGYPLDYYYA